MAIERQGSMTFDELDSLKIKAFDAGIDLYATSPIILEDCAQNQWYSPSVNITNTGKLNTDNRFSYSSGEVTYNGNEDITVLLITAMSLKCSSPISTLQITHGKNSVPQLESIIGTVVSTANDLKDITTATVLNITNGDTINLYVRQISETGTPDITIQNGKFIILKVF